MVRWKKIGLGLGVVVALAVLWLGPRSRIKAPTRTSDTPSAGTAALDSDSAAAHELSVSAPNKRDATRANAARTKIRALRESAARNATEPPTVAPRVPGDPTVPGDRNRSQKAEGALMPAPVGSGNQAREALGVYIRDVVREQFYPMVGGCYEELLARQPGVRGRFELSVVVGGHPSVGGVVEQVELLPGATIRDEAFASCVTESMMAVQFDAPPGEQGQIDFKYPFELAPDKPDASVPPAAKP